MLEKRGLVRCDLFIEYYFWDQEDLRSREGLRDYKIQVVVMEMGCWKGN